VYKQMSVLQSTDPEPLLLTSEQLREHELVLTMIAQPLLLSWEQLGAMPTMRIRCLDNNGQPGHVISRAMCLEKEARRACTQQRHLRILCFENDMREVDLSDADYEWRLL
jgi:hypothetical protein